MRIVVALVVASMGFACGRDTCEPWIGVWQGSANGKFRNYAFEQTNVPLRVQLKSEYSRLDLATTTFPLGSGWQVELFGGATCAASQLTLDPWHYDTTTNGHVACSIDNAGTDEHYSCDFEGTLFEEGHTGGGTITGPSRYSLNQDFTMGKLEATWTLSR